MHRYHMQQRQKQKGLTLLVAMIMLMMITVTTIATFNISRTGIQIVGNMQFNNEALDSANSAIQEAISTTRLTDSPSSIFLNPCNGNANTRCFDLNNDGINDYTVAFNPEPFCVQANPIPNTALDPAEPGDFLCLSGSTQETIGIEGATTNNSLCANSIWQINAVATDNTSNTNISVIQGASIRAKTSDIASSGTCI